MNIQGTNAEHHSFKIIFTNLQCKINLSDSSHFAFVIRIGKTSSRYTQKKLIHEGTLEFDSVLEVPVDQQLLSQQNPKKQKCEIMLYKFRINRQKQCKELVGMASVAVSNQMFDVQTKKLRLTNSFDKEAFVQCKLKIELGEADVLSHNESRLSSFHVRSEQPSLHNQLSESRSKQRNETSANKNHVRIGLITSNSRKSLRQASEQKSKSNNSILDILNVDQNDSSQKQNIKSEQVISQNQSSANTNQLIGSDKDVEQQNNKLKQMCQQLHGQNQNLKATIEHLQNQMLNQSIISNRSNSSQNPNIPRPGGNSKRSPMIKKNATITVTPSFSRLQPNGSILTQDILTPIVTDQLVVPKGPKKGQIIRAQKVLDTSRDFDIENSPYLIQQDLVRQTSKKSQQNLKLPLQLTFGGQRQEQINRFSLIPVIQVKYSPAYQGNLQAGSNDRDRSIIQSSISEAERKNCRSYTKFNGKRKYQMVGAIRSPDNSQANMSAFDQQLDQNHRRQGGSIILGRPPLDSNKNQDKSFHSKNNKQSPYNGFLKTESLQNQKPFLDFLKEKDESPFIKNIKDITQIITPKASHSILPIPQGLFQQRKSNTQLQADADGQVRSRLTLQELDTKTEQRFRKNERSLKIANMKILEENRTLKKQRKILDEEIQLKKSLSHNEFEQLRSQIGQLRQKIQQTTRVKEQSESKYEQLSKKFNTLQEENLKLKKDLREQKAKYDYYFKMSNINDDKQKERQNIGPWQKALTSKKSATKLHSEVSSPVENSKIIGKHDRSMTSISNFNKEDSFKLNNQGDKSLKKVDFSLDKNDEDHINTSSLNKIENSKKDIQKPTSSTAVSKLKLHIKPMIPKSPTNGILSQVTSPADQSFTGSNGSGQLGKMMSGLIGTGQTIIKDIQITSNFFQQK